MAFIEDLNQLLAKYNKTLADLAPMVPAKAGSAAPAAGRRQRKLKVYVNPTTGEKIETRGGNHKVLKAWKAQHGNDAGRVASVNYPCLNGSGQLKNPAFAPGFLCRAKPIN